MKLETLAWALQRANNEQLSLRECRETAWNILSFSGYGSRVVSNSLSSDELALFYMLEDIGIMRSETTVEYIPRHPRGWRVTEFVLCEDRINELASSPVSTPAVNEFKIYEVLPADAFVLEESNAKLGRR